jgi:hypothetical protein
LNPCMPTYIYMWGAAAVKWWNEKICKWQQKIPGSLPSSPGNLLKKTYTCILCCHLVRSLPTWK